MDYENNGIKHSILGSTLTGRAVRYARVAGMVGLLLAATACTVPDPPSEPGGSCQGFAGMQVPNCDFNSPPSY